MLIGRVVRQQNVIWDLPTSLSVGTGGAGGGGQSDLRGHQPEWAEVAPAAAGRLQSQCDLNLSTCQIQIPIVTTYTRSQPENKW